MANGALGHSYLTSPISRSDQTQSNSGCRGPACLGPCDIPLSQATRAPIIIQRGATINPQWPRNNHAGGFIRFAWAQTSQSDTASAFDNGVNTVYCHEIGGCKPDDPTDPNGGDSGPADGSVNPCQTTITVPSYLTDGLWTLQWAWFGGAFELGDYYSCVDYSISGGPTGTQQAAVYHGGDYSNPGQNVCKFFNTDRLHQCVDEPCSNPVYPLGTQETGPAFGIAIASSGSSTSSSSSSTSTSTSTSGKATTGHGTTAKGTTGHGTTGLGTTGHGTTAKGTTAKGTTGAKASTTTGKGTTTTTSSSTTGSSSGMCYLPGTPNVNGTILENPPYCGKNAKKARCADGQCCSKYGYCGPIPDTDGNYYEDIDGVYQTVTYDVAVGLYCGKGNQGDYRKVACSSLNNKDDTSADSAGVSIQFNSLLLIASVFFVALSTRLGF